MVLRTINSIRESYISAFALEMQCHIREHIGRFIRGANMLFVVEP